MSETELTGQPTPVPADQPDPAQSAVPPPAAGEPTYTQDELAAEAAALGVYPWDVAGIFKLKGVDEMTEAEFKAALEEWRAPLEPTTPPQGSN